MKYIIAINLFIFCSLILNGQSSRSYKLLKEETSAYLVSYDNQSPFSYGNIIHLDSTVLSKKHRKEQKKDNKINDLEYGVDSISEPDLAWVLFGYANSNIRKMLKSPFFNLSDLYELSHISSLGVATSEDEMFLNITLLVPTGGSYREMSSIIFYQGWNKESYLERSNQYTFEENGYDQVNCIYTETDTLYVLSGSVVGCNTCYRSHVTLLSVKNGIFKEEFTYDTDSRNWEGVSYDHDSKKIIVTETSNDLTSYESGLSALTYDPQLVDYHYTAEYKWSGKTFVLDKEDKIETFKNNSGINEFLSFKVVENNKQVKLFEFNDHIYYGLLKADNTVEFLYPNESSKWHESSYKISDSKDTVSVRLEHFYIDQYFANYNIYLDENVKRVGVMVETVDGKFDLKGDFNSKKGSLIDIPYEKLKNVID